jgi:hypothetical protein
MIIYKRNFKTPPCESPSKCIFVGSWKGRQPNRSNKQDLMWGVMEQQTFGIDCDLIRSLCTKIKKPNLKNRFWFGTALWNLQEFWTTWGCSHYVPFKFQWVPIMFSVAPHIHPICFGNWCPPFSRIWLGQRVWALYFKIEPSIMGSLHRIYFIFLSCRPNKLAFCKKNKNRTWEASHLINRRGE